MPPHTQAVAPTATNSCPHRRLTNAGTTDGTLAIVSAASENATFTTPIRRVIATSYRAFGPYLVWLRPILNGKRTLRHFTCRFLRLVRQFVRLQLHTMTADPVWTFASPTI